MQYNLAGADEICEAFSATFAFFVLNPKTDARYLKLEQKNHTSEYPLAF